MGIVRFIPGIDLNPAFLEKRIDRCRMKSLLIYLALFAGQMNTLQSKPVVRLHPHQDNIPVEFGGDMVVLANGPAVLHLPGIPPVLDSERKPWGVEVKNLGPGVVTIVGKAQFSAQVNVDRTLQIQSNGVMYSIVQ
jgi:hypothetical protein